MFCAGASSMEHGDAPRHGSVIGYRTRYVSRAMRCGNVSGQPRWGYATSTGVRPRPVQHDGKSILAWTRPPPSHRYGWPLHGVSWEQLHATWGSVAGETASAEPAIILRPCGIDST